MDDYQIAKTVQMKLFGSPDSSSIPRQRRPLDISPASRNRSAPKSQRRAVFFLIGSIGGMLGGVLGIGGGSAISPLLLLAGGLKPAQIAGTTLAAALLISAVGSGAYASLGLLNLGLAWPIAMGSATAAVLGAIVAKRLSMRLMLTMFILILPYFAAMELWPSFAAPELSTTFVSLVALGGVTGFISGLLGISGASLVVPSLVAFFLAGPSRCPRHRHLGSSGRLHCWNSNTC